MKITFKKYKGNLVPYTEDDREKLDLLNDDAVYVAELGKSDQRTIAQNRLIHKFCDNVAVELKKQNIPLQVVIKDGTHLTMLAVKELMFKNVVKALYGKDSTVKLDRDELNLVFDTVIHTLALKNVDTKNLLDKE